VPVLIPALLDTLTVVEGLVHALGTHPLLWRVWFMTGDTPTVVEGLVHALGTHPLLWRVWFMHWRHYNKNGHSQCMAFTLALPSLSLPSSFP